MAPTWVRGPLLAGLVSAAMSTFDSMINSSTAYFVRDIYQRPLDPEAGQPRLIKVS